MAKNSDSMKPRSTISLKSSSRRRTDLRVIHTNGRTLLLKLPPRNSGKSRNAVINELAKEKGINAAELWKRVQFAEKYDDKSLKQLLSLENLTWGHVRKLLTVEDDKKRHSYAQTANSKGWSPIVLACEIEGREGLKNLGGRTAKSRPLTPGTLHELKREAHEMLRLVKAFGCDGYGRDDLPKADLKICQAQLAGVIEKFDELRKELPDFMRRLKEACG